MEAKEVVISFTQEELKELREGYEEYLADQSPRPNPAMKGLATKIQLSEQTHSWIDRSLK